MLLQVGFVSYQSITNETLLKEGTLIKVKLVPVDPRSLLQGDYVILRYDISTISDLDNPSVWNEKVYSYKTKQNLPIYVLGKTEMPCCKMWNEKLL